MSNKSRSGHRPSSPAGLPGWQQDVMRQLAGQPCLLCHQLGTVLGIFVPQDSARYGGTPGKQRMCFYILCQACFALDDAERSLKVEQALLTGVRQQSAAWN